MAVKNFYANVRTPGRRWAIGSGGATVAVEVMVRSGTPRVHMESVLVIEGRDAGGGRLVLEAREPETGKVVWRKESWRTPPRDVHDLVMRMGRSPEGEKGVGDEGQGVDAPAGEAGGGAAVGGDPGGDGGVGAGGAREFLLADEFDHRFTADLAREELIRRLDREGEAREGEPRE